MQNISFESRKGDLRLLGENGAGKSTTINILCAILKKTRAMFLSGATNLTPKTKKSRRFWA